MVGSVIRDASVYINPLQRITNHPLHIVCLLLAMFFKVPSPIVEPSAPASGQSASETAAAAVGDVDANYRRRVAAAYVL